MCLLNKDKYREEKYELDHKIHAYKLLYKDL